MALVAFAANSVLTRAAIDPARAQIAPASFTALRLAAGAACLAALIVMRGGRLNLRAASPASAAALFLYAAPVSFAYVALDAGLGGGRAIRPNEFPIQIDFARHLARQI